MQIDSHHQEVWERVNISVLLRHRKVVVSVVIPRWQRLGKHLAYAKYVKMLGTKKTFFYAAGAPARIATPKRIQKSTDIQRIF
jgi:hypothetical protein